jgi:hypothetical protein
MIERTSATRLAASVLKHGHCQATIHQVATQETRLA